jgi:hypothetical protein
MSKTMAATHKLKVIAPDDAALESARPFITGLDGYVSMGPVREAYCWVNFSSEDSAQRAHAAINSSASSTRLRAQPPQPLPLPSPVPVGRQSPPPVPTQSPPPPVPVDRSSPPRFGQSPATHDTVAHKVKVRAPDDAVLEFARPFITGLDGYVSMGPIRESYCWINFSSEDSAQRAHAAINSSAPLTKLHAQPPQPSPPPQPIHHPVGQQLGNIPRCAPP